MKKRIVILLVLAIAALYACFIIMDFSRFFSLDYYAYMMPSAILKRLCVVLAALIVWITGKDGLDSTDSRLMKTAFIIICFAEAFLFYGYTALGISFFIACQILLCFRNGRGFRQKLYASCSREKARLVLAGVLLAAAYTTAIGLSYKIILQYHLLAVVCIYALLISASLWIGLANAILGLMPKEDSLMVAVGMLCFYCCDILVGLDEIMRPSLAWVLANSTIWLFYIPAVTLLALSCYRYGKSKKNLYYPKQTNIV